MLNYLLLPYLLPFQTMVGYYVFSIYYLLSFVIEHKKKDSKVNLCFFQVWVQFFVRKNEGFKSLWHIFHINYPLSSFCYSTPNETNSKVNLCNVMKGDCFNNSVKMVTRKYIFVVEAIKIVCNDSDNWCNPWMRNQY